MALELACNFASEIILNTYFEPIIVIIMSKLNQKTSKTLIENHSYSVLSYAYDR